MRFARLAVLAAVAVSATGCGSSSAAPAPPAASTQPATSASASGGVRPTPAAARAIVAHLWSLREAALGQLSAAALAPVEQRAALAEDRAYIADVRCGCAPQKDAHSIVSVVTEIPRTAPQSAFLAQVRTTNASDGRHPWYVIAVVRDTAGWKIAYLNFGGYKPRPPLSGLRLAAGETAAVTAGLRRPHGARRRAGARLG